MNPNGTGNEFIKNIRLSTLKSIGYTKSISNDKALTKLKRYYVEHFPTNVRDEKTQTLFSFYWIFPRYKRKYIHPEGTIGGFGTANFDFTGKNTRCAKSNEIKKRFAFIF